MPKRMPSAAVSQTEAAVVRPRTVKNPAEDIPAPRKPIPVMMPCAIRLGLVLEIEVQRRNAQPRRLVGWHQHQKREKLETDEGMRPDARGSTMEASFKAKQASGSECAYQTDRNVDAGVRQRGPFHGAVRSVSDVSVCLLLSHLIIKNQ